MKRERYIQEQDLSILKGIMAGTSSAVLSCRHSVAEGLVYHWKAKFGADVQSRRDRRVLEAPSSRGAGRLADECTEA